MQEADVWQKSLRQQLNLNRKILHSNYILAKPQIIPQSSQHSKCRLKNLFLQAELNLTKKNLVFPPLSFNQLIRKEVLSQFSNPMLKKKEFKTYMSNHWAHHVSC